MMPQQSKQRKDDVIIGPQDTGDVQSHRSSDVRSRLITNSETCPCFIFEDSALQIPGERVSQQCWPDVWDLFLTVSAEGTSYQSSQSNAC